MAPKNASSSPHRRALAHRCVGGLPLSVPAALNTPFTMKKPVTVNVPAKTPLLKIVPLLSTPPSREVGGLSGRTCRMLVRIEEQNMRYES
jgi:hypothetical protein